MFINVILCRQSKVYWSHAEAEYTSTGTIYRANLDGTEVEVLVNTNLLVVSKCNIQMQT